MSSASQGPSVRRGRAGLLLVLLGAALGDYVQLDTFRTSDPSEAAVRTSDGNELENGASRVEPLGLSSRPKDLSAPEAVPLDRTGSPVSPPDPARPRPSAASALRGDADDARPAYLKPYLSSSPHSRRSPPA
jgi:hypothetical protein